MAKVSRRQAREWALQLLVQFDLNPPTSIDEGIAAFWEQQTQIELEALSEDESAKVLFTSSNVKAQASLAEARDFAEERIRGVWLSSNELDKIVEKFLRNWSIYRLGTIERNTLRIGAWELINCNDIPAPIIVNEAIDLAKFFSETKSGKFVNGVMDNMAKELRKPSEETFTPAE